MGDSLDAPALWDFFRHWVKYSSRYNGPGGLFAGHMAALAAYVPVARQPNGFVPALVGYEGGMEQAIPGGLETAAVGGFYLTNQLSHDMYYDPEIYNAVMAIYQMCQQGGMSVFHPFAMCLPMSSLGGDSGAAAMWGNATWAGQPAGRGDGSATTTGTPANVTNLFWIDTGSAQHLGNAAVQMQAWRDWANAANPGAAAPAGAAALLCT